jgi:hypothetical protein
MSNYKVTLLADAYGLHDQFIFPQQFGHLLSCSSIPNKFYYYWWRAISAAYILRPNAATVDWFKRHTLPKLEESIDYISIYIRRGDKSREMRLVPVGEFIDAIDFLNDFFEKEEQKKPSLETTESGKTRFLSISPVNSSLITSVSSQRRLAGPKPMKPRPKVPGSANGEGGGAVNRGNIMNAAAMALANNNKKRGGKESWQIAYIPTKDHRITPNNPRKIDSRGLKLGKNNIIFLASEDHRVIQEILEWNNKTNNYQIHLTNIFDRSKIVAGRNVDERSRIKQLGITGHHPEEYLSMLLNLHYLVRSSSYICTLASNFCRVVDELRAFYGKADKPYVDLSGETCSKLPCLFDGVSTFQWRR